HPKGVHVPGERERPSVGHLHRQALRAGRRGDAQRQAQQQQRETLHTRFPPWEFTWPILPLVPSRRQLQLGSARYSEWERGPPTSHTRLASHLRLCERTGESGAHLLESESIVLRCAAAPAAPGRANARETLLSTPGSELARTSGYLRASAGAASVRRGRVAAQH